MSEANSTPESVVLKSQVENNAKIQTFEVDGSRVELTFTEAKPKNKEIPDPKKAVISISPWAWGAEMPIISGGGQKAADGFGENAYTLSTRTDKVGPEALLTEAKGIAKFIESMGLEEVSIVGHSEGGIKAVDLAFVLEHEYPQIKINGVVLLDPMGMNEDSILGLSKNFAADIFKVAPEEFKKAKKLPPEGGTLQFILSFWNDVKNYGLRWPKALYEESKAMARTNKNLGEIKSPVLIMTGEKDFVSDFRKYLTPEEVEARARPPLSDDKLREWILQTDKNGLDKWGRLPEEEKLKFADKDEFIAHYMKAYRKQEETVRLGRARNEILSERVIPEAKNAAILIASRIGTSHTGITDNRFQEAINLASRLFPRWERPNKTAA